MLVTDAQSQPDGLPRSPFRMQKNKQIRVQSMKTQDYLQA